MASRNLVGAACQLNINGELFAIAKSFSYTSSTPRKEIHSLDRPHPHELAPQSTTVKGSVTWWREKGSGGLQGNGIVAPIYAVSREKYFSIDLIDLGSGDLIIFHADRCLVEGETQIYQAGSRVQGSFSFTGIKWDNESRFKYLWEDSPLGE